MAVYRSRPWRRRWHAYKRQAMLAALITTVIIGGLLAALHEWMP